jgi:hypothetical protein
MSLTRTQLRIVLTTSACIALLALAYPMYVIRPFRAQGADELAAALLVRSLAPWLAGSAALIAIAATVVWWRQLHRTGSRVFAVMLTGVTVLFAALTHVNVYEIMFHRIQSPESMPASEAKLDGDDMVLAVRAGGHSRAYPIRMMGYHHIVNDWVGGVPVAATY